MLCRGIKTKCWGDCAAFPLKPDGKSVLKGCVMERLTVRLPTFGPDTEIITNENKQVWKATCNKSHDNGV